MKKALLIVGAVFLIAVFMGGFHAVSDFRWGYQDGYNGIQDTLENEKMGCDDYTEGICDWWDSDFCYQQGYEEGIKAGAKDYHYGTRR